MAFEIDIGFVSLAGRKDINEDFCAAMLSGGSMATKPLRDDAHKSTAPFP